MDFLVEFDIQIPDDAPRSEVEERENGEVAAAASDLLYAQSRGVRHGSAEVLARLARGEAVDASDYIFRTSTQIETADGDLGWLNKGVFVSVGGRQPAGVIYETYLVE